MRILIFGLPGSGKTTLASALCATQPHILHLNADAIRTEYNDWDFSPEGRLRQATRMRNLADEHDTDVIADFVAPTKELRNIYNADFAIWMDTISSGRYEDTNKAWQVPDDTEYNVRITEFISPKIEAERLWNLIVKHLRD